MSSDNNSSKLLMTAIGAALGGAVVSFAAFKYIEQRKELIKHRAALVRASKPSFSMSSEQRSESVIFPHNHEEKMRRRIAARVAVEEDNLTPRNSVTVRVPATSANLGPGCEFKLSR
jgi:hypothetical protein